MTWVWAPERKVVCTGDLWMEILPNCGNPQKVQRHPEGWADALEAIASLGAELLLPGHGQPIEGADAIRECCSNTAEALRAIVTTTLEGLNAGKNHEEILADIRIPEHLRQFSYLDPLYDRPEFIARNVIRKYGGWWDGFSSSVLPASMEARAKEIAELAGGASSLITRATELKTTDPRLACHLAEWAALAEPENPEAHQCVIDVFKGRAEGEISLMGRGILSHAARKSEKALALLKEGQLTRPARLLAEFRNDVMSSQRIDFANPNTPWLLRAFSAVTRPFAEKLFSLDAEELLATARERTGLEDFGPPGWRHQYDLLMRALHSEANLSPLGRYNTRDVLLSLLEARLKAERLLVDHPEILDVPVKAPIIIYGLPRTGTTLLQRLIARDEGLRHLKYWESENPMPLGSVEKTAARARSAHPQGQNPARVAPLGRRR